jgi:hypothetical protein
LTCELHEYVRDYFHDRILVFSTTFMMGEMSEEWKKSTIIPIYKKGDKGWKTKKEISTCYKLYRKIVIEELKSETDKFHLECRMDFEKADLASIHCLA